MEKYPAYGNNFEFFFDINNKIIQNLKFNPYNDLNLKDRDLKEHGVKILRFTTKNNHFYIDIKLPEGTTITQINPYYFDSIINVRGIIGNGYSITLPDGFTFSIIGGNLFISSEELDIINQMELNKKQKNSYCQNTHKIDYKNAYIDPQIKDKVEQAKKNLYPILTSMINSTKIEEGILGRIFVPFYGESGKKLKSDFHKLEKEGFIKIEKIFTANKEFKKEVEKIIKEGYSRPEVEEYAQEIDPDYNSNEEYNYYSIKILGNKKLIKGNYQIKYLVELDNGKKAEITFFFKTVFGNISNNDILKINLQEINFLN